MSTFEIKGVSTDIDLGPFLAEDSMVRFQDELVRSGVPKDDAATLSESLLTVLVEVWGKDYADFMEASVKEMGTIRDQLRSKYDAIRDTFSPDKPPVKQLPTELNPEAFRTLFDRLEKLMDEVESPEEYLHNEADIGELQKMLDEGGEESGQEAQPDPRFKKSLAPEPGEETFEPPATGFPRRSAAVRRQVETAGEAFVAAAWGGRARLRSVVKTPATGAASAAEYARLSGVDPVFAGRGYQLDIEIGGERFQPDAIGQEPGGFRLYDNKESFSRNWDESAYSDPEVQRELHSRMEKYASVARSAQGCLGWTFTTSSDELAALMRSIIEDIRNNPAEGEDLARFLSVDGPGGG